MGDWKNSGNNERNYLSYQITERVMYTMRLDIFVDREDVVYV